MSYEQPDKGAPAKPADALYVNPSEFAQGNNLHSNNLAQSIKETFFAYNNRRSDDNRSAQTTLGPSEIGTPCDRRIGMEILSVPPTNPGGDGFPSWLGTQGHAGMADIYEWADGGSGRFLVETALLFKSKYVPRGTGDLLDRTSKTFIDWKFMGSWSLNKLREVGPSETYRVQVQTYGLGAHERGERVSHVAIVGMPRQGSSLDEMYVWSQPLDLKVGRAALKRVDDLVSRIKQEGTKVGTTVGDILNSLSTADDCRFCPFHLPRSKDASIACSGNR